MVTSLPPCQAVDPTCQNAAENVRRRRRPGEVTATLAPAEFSGRRVLVVDSDDLFVYMLCKTLARHDLRPFHAANVAAAIAYVKRERKGIDLAVLDPALERDAEAGLQLIPYIRSRHPACSVVVVTDNLNSRVRSEATRMGAADIITKPTDTEAIVAALCRQPVTA